MVKNFSADPWAHPSQRSSGIGNQTTWKCRSDSIIIQDLKIYKKKLLLIGSDPMRFYEILSDPVAPEKSLQQIAADCSRLQRLLLDLLVSFCFFVAFTDIWAQLKNRWSGSPGKT